MAAALVQLARYDEARHAITVADKLNPANFGAVYAKASLLRLDGKSGLADRLIDRALRQAPVEGAEPLLASITKLMPARYDGAADRRIEPMKILFAWELSGNLGHISRQRQIAAQLRQHGHQVVFMDGVSAGGCSEMNSPR